MRSLSGTHVALIFIFAGVFLYGCAMVVIYGIIGMDLRDSLFLPISDMAQITNNHVKG